MSALDNKQLINLIRYAPVAVVFVFALAVNLIAIQDNRGQAALSIQNLRDELTAQRKDTIRSEVHQVNALLLLEKSKIENELRSNAKQLVYEAYALSNHLYLKNIDKPKAEIKTLILETLKSLHMPDGMGHFFVVDDVGKTVMSVASRTSTIKESPGSQNNHRMVITPDMIQITHKNTADLMQWRLNKAEKANNQNIDTIGYFKHFMPLNWSIGVADYRTDFESKVKARLLKWLAKYEYGDDGHLFVLDDQGHLLAQHANHFLGLDFIIGKKINNKLFKDIQNQVSHEGGFVQYAKPLTLSGKVSLDQVSYVKAVKDWGWIIGTGFSAQAFEKYLKVKEAELDEINHQSLVRLIYLTIASLLLLTLSTLFVSNLIARRFEMFQSQIQQDFDELNNTKDRMEYMALHDSLTSLPNRVYMMQKINNSIQSLRDDEKLALMFVDLDNFKNVNDLYGHLHGDLLLEVVSDRFKQFISDSDTVSRFGGDEFVLCFSKLSSKQEAEDKAKQIIESLSTPIIIDGKPLVIGCSIGVSMCPDDSTLAETLIRQADTVLYKSKADRKGQILFYSNPINEQVQRRIEIEHSLDGAIKQQELSVYYQPQIIADGESLVSVEALVRWEHAELGHIYPDEFIAIAEEIGIIHELDLFVFRKACEDILSISPNGKDALKLSVNISPIQLKEHDLAGQLINICSTVGIAPERITLEITENIFIHGLNNVQPIMSALRNYGFGVSLDDFGTGYSSLSYINQLPLTEIKIDRAFTEQFLASYQSDMLVRMIISLARVYHLTVVAEGVETKQQFKKLIHYGCDLFQGYYFDRPLTLSQLLERLNRTPKASDDVPHAENL